MIKHLEDPSVNEVRDAIHSLLAGLSQYEPEADWGGGGLFFVFAGHGSEDRGALHLADGVLEAQVLAQLLDELSPSSDSSKPLGVSAVLDSCHSGAFLAYLYASEAFRESVIPRDFWIGFLPNEKSWEYDVLGHGCLTYTLINPGSDYLDQAELAKAVRERDGFVVRKALQGSVPNPVTYLTNGEQTAIEVTNGHHVEVQGAGHFTCTGQSSLSGPTFVEQLKMAAEAQYQKKVGDI